MSNEKRAEEWLKRWDFGWDEDTGEVYPTEKASLVALLDAVEREAREAAAREHRELIRAAYAAIYASETLRTHPDIRAVFKVLRHPNDPVIRARGRWP